MSQDSDVEIIGETTNMIPKSKSSDDDDVMIIEDMSTDQSDMTSEDRLSLAEQKKDEGNLAYTAKKYRQALELYCQAIELCPDVASYYNNRSACYLMLGQYEKALAEAQASVARNPAYFKGQMRVARCCLSLGDTAGAETALSQAQTLRPELASGGAAAASNQLQSEWHNLRTLKRLLANVREAESAGATADWRRVLFLLELALKAAPAGVELRARRCHALVRLDRLEEAQLQVQQLLRSDVNNAEAFFVRGLCLYCSGVDEDVRRACLAFQHVLRLAPDHQRAKTAYKRAKELRTKKEQATTAFREGRLAEALTLYQQLLQLDTDNRRVNSKLHFNVATVLAKQNQPALSLDHCSQAIELSPNYIKAYLRRAKCYMELEQFEEAVRDYEKVFSMERTHEHRQLLATAKLELKKSKRKDFYKILGVGKQATDDEIKKAYRKQALSHHPDRHSSADTEERRVQEHKFKEVGEAYGVLSNKEKRRRYDNGQDLDEINGGSAAGADINVNDMFQQFFGSGAAGAAAGGPGPGMRFSSRMGQENFQFPGGSSFQFTFG